MERPIGINHSGISRTAVPFVVLVIALALTAVGTAYVETSVAGRDRLRFQSAVHHIEGRIDSRIATYTTMLRATDGLFAGTYPVLPDKFKIYAGRLDLPQNYPGVSGIGFAVRFRPADTAGFEQFMIKGMKFDGFHVWPASTDEDRSAVVYLEPKDHRNDAAIGYDMYTQPTRRDAMLQARDQGGAAATARVVLAHDSADSDPETGFIIYMPVYIGGGPVPTSIAERRAKIRGYVFCPFRSNDLFNDIFAEEAGNEINAWIYDGPETLTAEGLLYKTRSTSLSPDASSLREERNRDMAGRRWTVIYTPGPRFYTGPVQYLSAATGFAGIGLSAGLFLLIRSQVRGRVKAEKVTSDLRESRQALQEAKETAEAANRLKDEFLATVSHELRTPLNAILGWAQLLAADGGDPNDIDQGVQTILRNARMQAQLIEDLLDISRIVSGKLRLEARSVDLNTVIHAAIASVQLAAEAKGVRLLDEVGHKPALVWGDPDRLQQVIWNLLSNSIKFTDRNGTIHVRMELDGTYAHISVSDTGSGIDPEFLPYAFERFRQADGTLTRKHGGLGLGLSIVRNLVELHGGSVRAESKGLGQGATFTASLPLRAGSPPRPGGVPRKIPADDPPGNNANKLQGLKILVVDDDLDTRELIRHLLAAQHAQVITAGTVARAMDILRSQKIDVLISDLAMPEEDGYDLIRMVRELPEKYGGRIPAMALSALVRPEERQRAIATGYLMHLPKPVDAENLIVAVAELHTTSQRADVE